MDANDQRDSLHRHIVTSNSCFNDSTIKRFNVAKPFWRNVTLIALAHVALIAGLIRWSVAARNAPDAESLVWLSAGDLESGRSDNSVASSSKVSMPSVESEPLKLDEEEKEQPRLTQAKSEIELPKPTPMETPGPKATAKPKATT